MIILALLTLLLISNGSAEEEMVKSNVTGIIGQKVLLPCACSTVQRLVWQKNESVVGFYQEGKTNPVDQVYMNRTELFVKEEKTNCSLLLLNISSADSGVYTCYSAFIVNENTWKMEYVKVNLTVSEKEDITGLKHINEVESATAVSVSVPIMAVLGLLLAVAVLLTLLIKRRHRTITVTDIKAQEPMLNSV